MDQVVYTKEDWLEWRDHPVTEILKSKIRSLIEDGKERLAQSAGKDPRQDGFTCGGITVATMIHDFELEFDEGGAPND